MQNYLKESAVVGTKRYSSRFWKFPLCEPKNLATNLLLRCFIRLFCIFLWVVHEFRSHLKPGSHIYVGKIPRSGIELFPDCPRFCRLNKRSPIFWDGRGSIADKSEVFLFSWRVPLAWLSGIYLDDRSSSAPNSPGTFSRPSFDS